MHIDKDMLRLIEHILFKAELEKHIQNQRKTDIRVAVIH